MFRLYFCLAVIKIATAQVCEESAGPLINDICPPELVLGKLPNDDPACCDPAKLITTTAPTTVAGATSSIGSTAVGATTVAPGASQPTGASPAPGGSSASPGSATTTSTSTCVDKVHPKTGVSDCPTKKNLCNDPNYFDVMARQCPKTCGFCSSNSTGATTSPGGCVDFPNPRTGVSDCPSLAILCNDPNYITLMTTQCPKTCGRCNSSSGTTRAGTATTSSSSGTCQDRVNPSTGRSDCPARRNLCNNSAYVTLMREQCPATCGFC